LRSRAQARIRRVRERFAAVAGRASLFGPKPAKKPETKFFNNYTVLEKKERRPGPFSSKPSGSHDLRDGKRGIFGKKSEEFPCDWLDEIICIRDAA